MSKVIDLTGNDYGLLKVISRAGIDKGGNATWNCRCTCGNEKVIRGCDLKRGHVKSCGCLQYAVEDLTGNEYGRLTVIERAPNTEDGETAWKCLCTCGETCTVTTHRLKHKHSPTRSCGCLMRENQFVKTHGLTGTRIHNIWTGINQRCNNPNATGYERYGGKGITVCERWLIFENFYEDVSKLEHFGEKGYSLDRINNNGDYEPSNVRWADKKTQQRNKTNNRLVEYQDKQIPVAEAAELSGINKRTLLWRLNHGRQGEDLFKPPAGR